MNTNRKLVRDEKNGVWAGVLAGLANYFDADPFFVRMIFCGITFATGFITGLLVYIIMMWCMPDPEDV